MPQGCRAPTTSQINVNTFFTFYAKCRSEERFEGSMWLDFCTAREYLHEPVEFRVFVERMPKQMGLGYCCGKGASSSGKNGSALGGGPVDKTILQVQKYCAI